MVYRGKHRQTSEVSIARTNLPFHFERDALIHRLYCFLTSCFFCFENADRFVFMSLSRTLLSELSNVITISLDPKELATLPAAVPVCE